MSMIWPFSNRLTSFQQPQDDFQLLSNLQRASSLSAFGLQSGGFSAWTTQGKCFCSRGSCKNTCSAMPEYPWARHWSHNCSHRALRWTAGTRSRALSVTLKETKQSTKWRKIIAVVIQKALTYLLCQIQEMTFFYWPGSLHNLECKVYIVNVILKVT